MSDGEVPEDRCGFVLQPDDIPEHAQDAKLPHDLLNEPIREFDSGSNEWYGASKAACCWREVWGGADDGRCIWHAETDNKPADALITARADEPERLDGAYVSAVELGDAIDFEECRLWATIFEGVGLHEASFAEADGRYTQFPDAKLLGTQFPDASLNKAQFPDAKLGGAQFPAANLTGAQFPEADLRITQFSDTFLGDAQFPAAYLVGAQFPEAGLVGAQFPGAVLWDAQFPDADLWGTQFHDANLSNSDLTNADATRATFKGATLNDAALRDADLADADLTNARLHDAHLLNVRINEGTSFGNVAPDETRATRLTPAGVRPYVLGAADTAATFGRQLDYEPRRTPSTDPPHEGFPSHLATLPVVRRLHDTLQPKHETLRRWWFWYRTDRDALELPYEDLGKANTVYRTIQRLYRENSMPRRIDTYYVRARDTRRKQAIIDGDLPRWLYLAAQRWVMGYGERPWRVVATSGLVILGCAVAYPLVGGVTETSTAGGTPHYFTVPLPGVLPAWVGLPGVVETVLTSLYFSVVTFTTLGYGDLRPRTGAAQFLATVESLVGAFLLALLVYVLGRRATR